MNESFIPRRLTQLRMQRGDSARDMSISLGQNVNYINSIENKKMLPSMNGFFYICEYLSITPKEFFDVESECPKLVREIVTELNRLKEEQLICIRNLLKDLK